MSKYTLLISSFFLLSSAAMAMNEWEGDYKLDNGLKITRTSTKIKIDAGFTLIGKYNFKANSRLNNSIASEDGFLSTDLTAIQFRTQLLKLGKIIDENVVENK